MQALVGLAFNHLKCKQMKSFYVVATTSGALPLNTDLRNSTKRKLVINTAKDGTASLRVDIGVTEHNNEARMNGVAAALPEFKIYPDIMEFLAEWTSIEADPMQVERYDW